MEDNKRTFEEILEKHAEEMYDPDDYDDTPDPLVFSIIDEVPIIINQSNVIDVTVLWDDSDDETTSLWVIPMDPGYTRQQLETALRNEIREYYEHEAACRFGDSEY